MSRPKPLRKEDVLRVISIALGQGRGFPSNHFRQRMKERNFDINDAIQVLENATEVKPRWNVKATTWNYDLPGMDVEAEELTIRVAITPDGKGLILVTGF